jgi:xylitol oxidase
MQQRNWAGNYSYSSHEILEPQTVAEVQECVRRSARVKTLGSRHSFNAIADTVGTHISMAAFRGIEIDTAARTVSVGAGVRYGDLAPVLTRAGFALHNLASLPHISIAGATATATHGSGNLNGNLATAVNGLEFVDGTGEVVHLLREKETFAGAAVHLGALGVATRVTLDVEPSYEVAQQVYFDLPFVELKRHLEEIFSAGTSVSLFTDWQQSRATQAWVKRRVDRTYPAEEKTFYGAKRATAAVHPLRFHPAEACTEQGGKPGLWFERLPHFRMDFTPSSGEELQSEYFVPLEAGYEAIRAVEELRDSITPHLFVTELRTVEADDLWMSMAYQRRSLAIHFTWKPEWKAVESLLPRIERRLEEFGARPHWGKLFTLSGEAVQARYSRAEDFRRLMRKYDPDGRFRNDWVDRIMEGKGSPAEKK